MLSSPPENNLFESQPEGRSCETPMPLSPVMQLNSYDILVVGSGIACSMTLCELADNLKATPAEGKRLRIGVIEKAGEFWNGIPYGQRSLVGMLAFQKLQDFLDLPERNAYIEWLVANKQWWLKMLLENGGPGAARWVADNGQLIDRGKWEELYLPRFLFGMYVSDRTSSAIDQLAASGQAAVTQLRAEAVAANRGPGNSHVIVIEDGCGTRSMISAERVVLAIGSPPQRSVHDALIATNGNHTHIDDLYSPSEETSLRRIKTALASLPDKKMRNVLILGSNASALEILYLLNYRPDIKGLINSVLVISRSGLLPYKICEQRVEFEFTAIESLRRAAPFRADDLMAAITLDLRRAEDLKVNIADLQHAVTSLVTDAITSMDITEQEKFYCQHGFNYSRLLRRAGRDTRDAADNLVSTGILTIVKGDFRRLEPAACGDGLVSAVYTGPGGQETIHPLPFSITINCGGFEELDCCSSELINSLIANDLCKINSTNRGFLVNERLEASKNLYVIGPLVGGNFNDKVRFWHVESASRIARLSKLLAESLCSSLFRESDGRLSDSSFPADVVNSGAGLQHLGAQL